MQLMQFNNNFQMMKIRRANNGVSLYPSYQKIFQLTENFWNIYRNLSIFDEFSLNFLSILQNFLWNYSDKAILGHFLLKLGRKLF